jgi:dynein heavy chain, axonemal
VARLEKEYHDSTRELQRITDQVNRLEASLSDLAKKLDTALSEKTKIENEAAIMERRLIAADKLINGLSSENKRFCLFYIL